MDARIGYRLREDMDISITGQNLLDSKQPETVVNDSIYIASQIERGFYLRFTWDF
jgi:outer membrane receptor protein involved in Fe transport